MNSTQKLAKLATLHKIGHGIYSVELKGRIIGSIERRYDAMGTRATFRAYGPDDKTLAIRSKRYEAVARLITIFSASTRHDANFNEWIVAVRDRLATS